jgi:L-ascorbate metabolism protein UlaG (beta-lactamase superfamily)
MAVIQHIRNPELKTILDGWQGNPHNGKRFFDPNKPFSGSFSKFWKWQTSPKPKAKEKKADTWRLETLRDTSFLESTKDCIVWLGHASYFMRLNGVQIITDPVFYTISGVVRRLSDMPCAPSDFRNIDYVLLSHGHRDHCDQRSLRELYANNKFELLTGLNIGKLVSGWLPGLRYQEAGWYQQYKGLKSDLQISYLPTQHWSNRYPWDLNETLWGSMMIHTGARHMYFGGDSGYCEYPKTTAELFPSIDVAMIGVGAYTPDFMMRDVHTNPHEAVQIIHDINARTFIPMHYGTYDLADEPLGEPERILRQLEQNNQIKAALRILKPGEIHKIV